jgi:PAS domain S-box-containing protein
VIPVAYYLSYLLLLVTAGSWTYAAWRHRDSLRFDVLIVVWSLVLLPLLGGRVGSFRWLIQIALTLAQPYFLLRLVRHVRAVPLLLWIGAVSAIGVGTAAIVVAPSASVLLSGIMSAYVGALLAYVASAFAREARRTSGVTAMRLMFAASGTLMLGAESLPGVLPWFPWLGDVGGQINPLLSAAMLGCYFLAFNPPRRLASRWQRTEQARYLSGTADRGPEERGERAADDLRQAAARSVSHSAVFVALRPTLTAPEFVVRAATDSSWVGASVTPAPAHLIGRACSTAAAVLGQPDQLEADVAGRVTPLGAQVLVAPILSASETWGVVLVVQRHGSLFPDDDLRLLAQLGRYAGTALDHAHLIAEAKARERRLADRRVHEVESQMGLMLDSIKDYAMFVLDRRGHVVTWHPGAEHLFGYGRGEMTDEAAVTLFAMSPGDFAALLDEAGRSGRAAHEGPCRRRDGSKFVGVTVIRPLARDQDAAPGFVAVTHDVTQRRELEHRLRQGQKMEALGQLAGGIAHDFNNLLLAIMGYAESLDRKLATDDERRQETAEILRAAERAAGLTRQLMAFTQRKLLEPKAIDLSRLVASLLPMLRRMISERVEIIDETRAKEAVVLGDRNQVEQIILNLALNARDAMPAGGRLTIRTSIVRLEGPAAASGLEPGPYVRLDVTDTGVGMDVVTQGRIFEPFFTTKELGGGTGLGLATVYGIVRQMGGEIQVESEPALGTTFRMHFPETHEREVPVRPPAPEDLPRGRETLLLVEDDAVVSRFLAGTLSRHGYQVLTAAHATAAVTLVRAYLDPIHLVITDVVLPGVSGPELIRTLAEIRPGLPTLYISGYADAVLARQGTFPKASHFLQKPFSAIELLTRVRQILQSE